jgi:UDP-N-acetylglucosamine transferase subunit ALG13
MKVNLNNNKARLGLVCTAGGHFEQLFSLSNFYQKYPHFWITNSNKQTESALAGERSYFLNIAHYKKPWDYFGHINHVLRIFRDEKPTHIISTGSGRTSLIPFLVSKIKRIPFIYIETYSRVNNLTLFGKFVRAAGTKIHTQWENGQKGTMYVGPVFQSDRKSGNAGISDGNYVFVTFGTRDEPFTRLVIYLEQLVTEGVIDKKVIIQAGKTAYQSEKLQIFDFCSVSQIDELIRNASYIITQESAGIGNKCLKYGKRFIVMPRDYQFGELPSKHDMEEDLQYRLEELGYTKVVHTKEQLADSIKNIGRLKTGYKFDNSRAVEKLTEMVGS